MGIQKVRASEEVSDDSPGGDILTEMIPAPLPHRIVTNPSAKGPLILQLLLMLAIVGRVLKG